VKASYSSLLQRRLRSPTSSSPWRDLQETMAAVGSPVISRKIGTITAKLAKRMALLFHYGFVAALQRFRIRGHSDE
jgi:hypothetical protein